MSKVLFTHSYFYKLDAKQWRFKQPYPPLATILAASVVRNSGFEIHLVDSCLRDDPTEINNKIEELRPDYFVIYDDGFNYLTKMCLTVMRDAAFTMAAAARRAGCTVIVSSSDASDHYSEYFDHGVDYVVREEGKGSVGDRRHCIQVQR
jgi:anaerobic magnesium-protoporphyrin IX monomethyl ester cyclase